MTAMFALSLRNLTPTQFAFAVMIIAVVALVFGWVLMWLLSWLTATPVRVVRTALEHVEQGDLDTSLVVFDGTELGELQRGFNSMVAGLRERERVRDLFGRHVGREVAAAAEQQRPKLGGEERHVAVIFVDIIGSTQLVTGRRATEVVELLNRLLRGHRRRGRSPPRVRQQVRGRRGAGRVRRAEPPRQSRGRGAGRRSRDRPADPRGGARMRGGHRCGSGQAVAGNVGAKERFEYTVIGEPVNEAARLCELAKDTPGHLLASSDAVSNADEE